MFRLWQSLVLCLLALGCAHAPRSTGLSGLKPFAEDFHRRIRWKDYRGAANLLVLERREAFLAARREQHDERDLSITDYDIEDARMKDELHAKVVTRLSWVRLPSPSEHTETVTSEFVFREGSWWLERQDAGPFAPELSRGL
jgi:hypothetical protein